METKNYEGLVDAFYKILLETNKDLTQIRLSEDKWSLKEIIGHLIDSASNNHQRFVRLQFDDLLGFPAYDGEKWIEAEKYIKMDWNTLISLWCSFNKLLLNIIEYTDEKKLKNVWIKEETAIPLENLIVDYFRHMEIHIEHFKNRVKEIDNCNS